jgi:hypothetical protein
MKKNDTTAGTKWYDRFVKQHDDKKPTATKSFSKDGSNSGSRTGYTKTQKRRQDIPLTESGRTYSRGPDAKLTTITRLFETDVVPEDAQKVLNSFSTIVQGVFPSSGKQQLSLPNDVRRLSHELTDERNERRVGYMNTPSALSAYVHYFMWWNLVRLTRLFANLGSSAFPLDNDDCCLDIGSGPLTIVIALWLACPELRSRKITWYCMDISQNALSLGEDIYLSITARTPPEDKDAEPHWNIIRVKGAVGTEIRKKASFITCANMFNELYQDGQYTPEYLAEKYTSMLLSYAAEKHTMLVVEPGVPRQARIISLMRDSFIKAGMSITAPCPHAGACAMDGLHARMGGTTKWCNFAFTTDDAPRQLQELSTDAGIPKERAVLSFIIATNTGHIKEKTEHGDTDSISLSLRVASAPIRLPEYRTGYYACSRLGLTLIIDASGINLKSGDLITAQPLHDFAGLSKDAKTGAKEVTIIK